MINVIIAGVGGQGTVLAAKVLAVAAAARGWNVRTAETIGMAQRGGSVVSHIRIGNNGEDIHAPLVTKGSANLIIAFEPGEAARAISYLARSGTIVMATTPIEPVSATLSVADYNVGDIVENIQLALYNAMVRNITQETGAGGGQGCAHRFRAAESGGQARLFTVDDRSLTDMLGGNRKVLNSIMIAEAVRAGCLPFTEDELCAAIGVCVKPQYADMNLQAVRLALTA